MFSGRYAAIPPLLIIAGSLSVGVYFAYGAYVQHQREAALEAQELGTLEANRENIRRTLAGVAGLSATEVERGFWYQYKDEYGNRTVLYFDLENAARLGLTAEQLASLKSHVASSSILRQGAVQEVREKDLPPILQFHNAIYGSAVAGTSTKDMERSLESRAASGAATSDDLLRLSYLAELSGDYAKRDALNTQNCRAFKVRCIDAAQVTIRGRVVDAGGGGVAGVSISIMSRPGSKSAITDTSGAYAITTGAKDMEKIRLRAIKRNFSDGYADVIIVQGAESGRTYTVDDIRLESPVAIVTIDYLARKTSGLGNSFNQDDSITLRTSRSTYEIPARAIVHADGRPYDGDSVDVYLYEFSKGSPPPNLTQLDTFDAVRGYAGDLMKSFGMPFIQFFSKEGEELHVRSSKPMTLTYRIADMDALYANTDKIYQPLTPADMQLLVAASQGKTYPIDRAFLIEHHLLRFPAFWVFDRKRGVWDNVGINVLDVDGTIRIVFYTMRDV